MNWFIAWLFWRHLSADIWTAKKRQVPCVGSLYNTKLTVAKVYTFIYHCLDPLDSSHLFLISQNEVIVTLVFMRVCVCIRVSAMCGVVAHSLVINRVQRRRCEIRHSLNTCLVLISVNELIHQFMVSYRLIFLRTC